MIFEDAIMYVSKLMDYNLFHTKLIDYIKNKFSKKGEAIVNANIGAIESVKSSIEEIVLTNRKEEQTTKYSNIYEAIFKREGNKLPTSSFLSIANGTVDPSTSKLCNGATSEFVPSYIKDNCINCNQCTLACPHSVIRSYLLSSDEYEKAPEYVKKNCKPAIGLDNFYFTIGISIKNCTGCGLCINTCPGLRGVKALTPNKYSESVKENIQEAFDYLDQNITKKDVVNTNTIKGLGFVKPKFEYCGACAGCGEAAYIKILTQLFGDNLVVANATGCSSIYGGSMPSTPYNIPWASSLFEDNAEYGYGMLMSNNVIRNRIKNIMENNMDNPNKELFTKWIENSNDYKITKEVSDKLTSDIPEELKKLKDYIPSRNYWCIGGDGWAYDIGFSGIDHVLASGENINILVLDTEVYSNTGGQSSKSSNIGSIASFTSSGKKTNKKDLARIAMSYKNVYVAQISLGSNMMQVIKTLKEANDYPGPSIVIAYSPCISHGIKGGMNNSLNIGKLAVDCGYFLTFRRNPNTGFTLDSKNVDFTKYDEFLSLQTRYSMLKSVNPNEAEKLLEENKKNAMEKFEYYSNL